MLTKKYVDGKIHTLSLCPTCYKEIPAVISFRDGGVWMDKTCSKHGEFAALIECDERFYKLSKGVGGIGFPFVVDVTDRCNLNCAHCYHPLNNRSTDPSIQEIVQSIQTTDFQHIHLMGGEPTVRDDLPSLIYEIRNIGRQVFINTNGLKLADSAYLQALIDAGIGGFALSLHHPDYQTPQVYAKKLLALENMKAIGWKCEDVFFTLSKIEELPDVLNTITSLNEYSLRFRIRSPFEIGKVPHDFKPIFLSDLLKSVRNHAKQKGLTFRISPEKDNNIYHTQVVYGNTEIRLIRSDGVKGIDLNELRIPPFTRALNGQVANFMHARLINEGLHKGWLNGQRHNVY